MKSFKSFLTFAVETASAAGKLTLAYFQKKLDIDFKDDDSPVTIADRQAESLIRARIEKKYPSHSIIGEEEGYDRRDDAFRWLIDPIDGTNSFICGVPLYGVLLALEIERQIKVGVSYFPALDDMIYAAEGLGARWNGKAAFVSNTNDLSRVFLAFTDSANFEKYGKKAAWERLQKATYYRAGWCDAYGHALVATGRIDLMLDPIMNPWDCGPFPVILSEAGGYFGDWHGVSRIDGGEALSTNGLLLPEILKLLETRA
jgi:histidinol-phosphatase